MIFQILLNIIAPIFIIIGVGFFLAKRMSLDIASLSKLNFFVFVPALIFVKLATVDYEWTLFSDVLLFSLIFIAVMLLIAFFSFGFGTLKNHRNMMSMGVIFFNAGNYGIPLVLLAFDEKAIPIITIVLMLQNLLTFTLGIILIKSGGVKFTDTLKSFLRVPVLYAVILGVALKAVNFELANYTFIYEPLNYLANGLIPIALLTLGCQMANCKLNFELFKPLCLTNIFKLIVAPIVGYIIAKLLNFEPFLRDVLVVISGLPTAVNIFILASEYKKDEELSSQIVFSSTLLSAFSLSIIILIMESN